MPRAKQANLFIIFEIVRREVNDPPLPGFRQILIKRQKRVGLDREPLVGGRHEISVFRHSTDLVRELPLPFRRSDMLEDRVGKNPIERLGLIREAATVRNFICDVWQRFQV